MQIKVNQLLENKINEIQGRLPVKMKGLKSSEQSLFSQSLEKASSTLASQDTSAKQAALTLASISGSTSIPNILNQTGLTNQINLNNLTNVSGMTDRARSIAAYPSDKAALMDLINENINSASAKYGVDANLVKAVIKQESAFNPAALSKAGAQGLMQLMPETAAMMKVSNPWDIEQNINGGVKYLRDQLNNFKGDVKLALAAYNAGPNAVRKYNGIPPYAETQGYVTNVLKNYAAYLTTESL